ncbi:MAG: LCP family protein [Clostridium sp.]|nr:LCP family protein [Clostridium sp.]
MRYEEDDELERMRARRERRQRAWKDETEDSVPAGRHSEYQNGRTSAARRHSPNYKSRRKEKKRRVWLIVLEVLLVLALLAGGVVWFLYQKTFGTMQKIEFHEEEVQNLDLTEEQIEEMKGYFTVVCFGVDSRAEGAKGELNVGKGTNADVNMIVRANLETGEVKIVSVFRDTYLNISDKNSYNKINAAYAFGGPEQAVKALNKNLALNITQYATFNWKAVAEAINILGGVDVDLSDAEFSWINAYISETVKETGVPSTQLEHGGHVHLDGIQAVAYARIRYSDTDYARTERQRIVVEKALEKAKQADFKTLYGCMHVIMPQLATNLQPDDLYPLAKIITKFNITDTMGFPMARGEKDMGKIGDCVIPQTLAYNVVELHKFLFDEQDFQIPSRVQEISDHIANTSGYTRNGKLIGHVPTDEGIGVATFRRLVGQSRARREALQPVSTEESTKSKSVYETDEDGNIVYEYDEDGNIIYETDEDGNNIYPTDEDGNNIYPTDEDGNEIIPEKDKKKKKPVETDENGDPILETDEDGNVIDPPEDEDEDEEDGPTRPEDEQYGPGGKPTTIQDDSVYGPGGKPSETRQVKPGSETTSRDEDEDEDEEAYGPGASERTPETRTVKPGSEPEETKKSSETKSTESETKSSEKPAPTAARTTEDDSSAGPGGGSSSDSGSGAQSGVVVVPGGGADDGDASGPGAE